MKKILSFALAGSLTLIGASNVYARNFNLQGTTYSVDTISHYLAGPATNYSRILVSSQNNKFNASILEIDLKESNSPAVELLISKNSVRGLETISSMANNNSNASKRYIGGTNGDFFVAWAFGQNLADFWGSSERTADDKRVFTVSDILGNPNTTCVINGEVVSPNFLDLASNEKALIICEDGNMYIDGTDLSYTFSTVLNDKGTMKYITRSQSDGGLFNFPRNNKDLTIYNRYYGTSTKTADEEGSYEVALQLKDGEKFRINEPFKMKVLAKNYGKGNTSIPENGIVLSGGKKRSTQWGWIDQLNVGDDMEITVNLKLSKAGTAPKGIQTVLGGDVKILNAGNVTPKDDPDTKRFINEASAKYIRTMIGYNEDRSKLIMCTVDRECGGTGGVTYFDAGDLMRECGCYDALDLDGGGSTEMWLKSSGVANYLRDKVEREIGNAVYAVVYGPEDNTVRSVRFADHSLKLKSGDTYKPVYFGYNNNTELINLNVTSGVKLSCTPATAGTVNSDGSFLCKTNSPFVLTATFNGQTHEINVNGATTAGVNDIFADDSVDMESMPVEYFDVRGYKVQELEPGKVYIRKQGNRVTKVVM